ncbi:hypothetical protein D9M73_148700 [compost metagenome]
MLHPHEIDHEARHRLEQDGVDDAKPAKMDQRRVEQIGFEHDMIGQRPRRCRGQPRHRTAFDPP